MIWLGGLEQLDPERIHVREKIPEKILIIILFFISYIFKD